MAVTYQGGDIALNYSPLRQDALRQQSSIASQEQQARKAQENSAKQAADIVAKINPNGLRDADIPEFSKKYEQFRNAAIGVANAGSIQERAKASAELQNQLTDLQIYINSSKNQASTLKDFGTRLSTNPQRARTEQFSRFDQVTKTPTSQLQNVDLNNEFKLGARPEVFERFVKQAGDEVQKEASQLKPVMRELGYIRENGRVVKRFQDVATIPQQTFIAKLANGYETNPEIKDYIDEQSSQLGVTPEQFIQRNVEANKDKLTWAGAVQNRDFTPRRTGGSGGESQSEETASTYRQQQVLGLLNNDKDSLERVKAQLLPDAEINYVTAKKSGKKYIQIAVPYNAKTGADEKTVLIDYNDRQAPTKLNTYLSLITGENISGSKFGIESGKPRGKLSEPLLRKTPPNKATPKATPNKKTTRGELD